MKFATGRTSLVVAAIVVAALVLIKVGLLQGDSRQGGRAGGGPGGAGGGVTAVRAVVLGTQSMTDRISTVGTILANEDVDVRSEISGRVEAISFAEGSRVAKGQLLVKIADAELRAQTARAESRLAIAESDAERQRQLFEQSLTSQREFDTAMNEFNVAKAEAALVRAQLDKTEIRAPFDGKVGLRFVSEGSYVSPATPITAIQDDTPVKLDFSVPERYAGRLKKGDGIRFTVQGTSRVFEGTIYALEPSIDTATRTMRVRATSPNEDGALVPGAFADVEIVMQQRDTIAIPAYALIPELKGHRVFVYAGGKAEARSVEIGTRTDENVEIVRGLSAGDTLITSAILQLRTGAPVTVAGIDSMGGGP
ncbi:MAG TPA: efflux RND transporter periplasmic adaptor subunit [Candidatus Krumholzibacteria bacterium]|nr:efflux RND transporter periplasmic adaptor subunit [Candidatus Krumholzibacteria bacterium]